MSDGFGSQGFGSTPYGIGTPTPATAPSGALLRDPLTGRTMDARRIDPSIRDYAIDTASGRILGMSATKHNVLLAVHTEIASSAMRELGQDLRSLDRITSNFQRRLESTLTNALKHLIDRELVRVLGITSFKAGPNDGLKPGQTYGRLKFVDLTTGKEHEVDF